MWRLCGVVLAIVLALGVPTMAAELRPLLAHSPTLSSTQIVFSYGGYLWSVPRAGGDARQITTGGHEELPIFSPDGRWIAFTGQYDGNLDVYAMPADGGEPKRLTWHPGADIAVGWTPDGKKVLFRSSRESYADFDRLYTVPVGGGVPEVLPMWRAEDAWFSPDGTRIAYVPNLKWQASWKRYKGGQTTPIYIVRLSDLSLEKVPRENSNDDNPVWMGDTIYFLSDRKGAVTLFGYDTKTKIVKQMVENEGLDLKSVSAGPDALVYEQFGGIYLFEPKSGNSKQIEIRVVADLPATRPHYEKVAEQIQNAGISPSGERAVFEAHGDILTVPAEKGDTRNLTRTTAVAERDPAWSPDGKWIAFFSDESGEYALHLEDQSGLGEVKKIGLGDPPSYFYRPVWSPDSKKIAYTDKRLNLWYVEVETSKPMKVDTNNYDGATFDIAWSPDSKWLAYTKILANHFRTVFVYSLEEKKSSRVTDGLSDARYPAFDKSGKTLYFAASTDLGLSSGWFDLSSFQHPVSRNVYAVVLKKGDPSPITPESDEEKTASGKNDGARGRDGDKGKEGDKSDSGKINGKGKENEEKRESVHVTIDFDQIGRRIVVMPIKSGNYVGLEAGKPGILFTLEVPPVPSLTEPTPVTVSKFDLNPRKTELFLNGVSRFILSADGEKALYQGQGLAWFIVSTTATPKPGEGGLNVESMEVYVDPRAEWAQMYHEVWRIERDFFYDPNHHGLNMSAAEKKYEPYLKGAGGREDVNYLFEEMLGELSVSHVFIGGGDFPQAKKVNVGLLGADYKIENSRYRFARVFNGDNKDPELRSPLSQPGVDVEAGEYLLEVNGREVRTSFEVYSYFENTAGKQVLIKVGPNPDGKDSREVTVVPLPSEGPLRNVAWEEDNRRKVDELSGGKVAYVRLPDTSVRGYIDFNRYYFAQVGKEAVVLDERYNHGGQIPDYFIDSLERPLRLCGIAREGESFCSPLAQIYGPKTMIANEMSGSGGDSLPWMFKQDKVGALVGTRTWGGLVGAYGYPSLMDGGGVTAPRVALYGLRGEWEVENHGIAPDIEVENDPASVAAGHDPQLERAVQVTLEALKKRPVVIPPHPPYPNYHPE
jgi:tricorn protease